MVGFRMNSVFGFRRPEVFPPTVFVCFVVLCMGLILATLFLGIVWALDPGSIPASPPELLLTALIGGVFPLGVAWSILTNQLWCRWAVAVTWTIASAWACKLALFWMPGLPAGPQWLGALVVSAVVWVYVWRSAAVRSYIRRLQSVDEVVDELPDDGRIVWVAGWMQRLVPVLEILVVLLILGSIVAGIWVVS